MVLSWLPTLFFRENRKAENESVIIYTINRTDNIKNKVGHRIAHPNGGEVQPALPGLLIGQLEGQHRGKEETKI